MYSNKKKEERCLPFGPLINKRSAPIGLSTLKVSFDAVMSIITQASCSDDTAKCEGNNQRLCDCAEVVVSKANANSSGDNLNMGVIP